MSVRYSTDSCELWELMLRLHDRSEYQNLPLLPIEDFVNLAKLPTPPAGLIVPVPEDPHELMLARLQFELTERQR